MRSASSARTHGPAIPLTKAANRQALKARMFPVKTKSATSTGTKSRAVSWWAPFADPRVPRAHFFDAARAYNASMRLNPQWQQTAKLNQIGQL